MIGASSRLITTVVLDVDGVLLDPTRAGRGSWHAVLEERYGVDRRQFRSAFFQRAWPDVIVGRTAIEPAVAAVIEEFEWPVTVEELLACWFEADFVVNDEVVGAAATWAHDGVRLVLATNQEHRRALPPTTTGEPVADQRHRLLGSHRRRQARPRFFPAACDALGIAHHDTAVVFVDDALDNVEAARDHGWTGVHFVPGSDWRDQVDVALRSPAPGANADP